MSSPENILTKRVPIPEEDSLRAAVSEVWRIAWPTVLSMTSYTVMQFIDRLMVGQVGPLELAAQGNGGIWAFVLISIGMGFLTVINTFVSQNLGANRPENGPKYAWNGLWLSLAWWVLLLGFAAFLPLLFGALHERETIDNYDALVALEVGYCRVLLVGGIIVLASRTLHHYFFGMHRPKVVAISAGAGNITNVLANYVLIFGEQGIPALGLPGVPGMPAFGLIGAAYGTLLGGLVELIIPALLFLGPKLNAEFQTRAAWRPRWRELKDLWRVGWPAAIQYGNEMVCWALFMTAFVGYFGEEHITAGWIALGYMQLSFMPAVGFAVAITSIVGRYIGAQRHDTAASRARLGLGISLVYMTTCALVYVLFREPLIRLFIASNVPPDQAAELLKIGSALLICAAFFQTVDAVGIVYTGALRGAGDTVFPGVMTVIYSWVFIVGGGWFMIRYFPDLESVGPWIAAAVYIFLYGITMGWRFESGRWRSIKLVHDEESDAARHVPMIPTPPETDPNVTNQDYAAEWADEAASRPVKR